MKFTELNLDEILMIYDNLMPRDFPSSEIRPRFTLKKLYKRQNYRAFGLIEDGKILAYAFLTCCDNSDCILLDYLAVDPEHRSRGLGAKMLEKLRFLLLSYSAILIETEDIDLAIDEEQLTTRTRRNRFYTNCGAYEAGIKTKVFGVGLTVFYLSGAALPKGKIKAELTKLYDNMLYFFPFKALFKPYTLE